MKKILFLVLLTSVSYGQTTLANKLKITGNATSTTAVKINVQEADGTVNTITKSDLIDVFYFASAMNLPFTGITDRLYVTRDNNILYRFTGSIYVPLNDISNKVDKVANRSLILDTEITRLATLANYTHPANHQPSIITQDASNRFTTDAEKAIWNAKQNTLGFTPENISNKGIANGYASLDNNLKVPLSQINDALLGSVNYKGTYNAATNTPTLPLASNKGFYYVVSTAGTQQSLNFVPGDWIISDGTNWGKVDNNNSVTSVNSRVGAVVVNKTDVGLSNVPNTDFTSAVAANTAKISFDSTSSTRLANTSGTNTGDQTTITGNAGSATVLQTARTINGVSFNGSANITVADASKEPTFAKNTAFNTNFGTTTGTSVQGGTLGSNAFNSTAFLPLTGGDLTGALNGTNLNSTGTSNFATTSGNVGIGTTTPTEKLEVNGNIKAGQATFSSSVTATSFNGALTGNATTATNTVKWDGKSVNYAEFTDPLEIGGLLGNNVGNGLVTGFSKPAVRTWLGLGANAYNSTAFLPLTGGTMTGALNGTSATFSSSLTATSFFQSSDRRLKTILKRDGNVAYFKWKDKRDEKIHIGYIAQEVKKEFPDQVQEDEKGMLSVNYIEILVAKIQDLENRIKQLEKK